MGVKSIPIVVVTALFTGAIMVIQAAPLVKRFGADGLLGWGAGFGTLREIAPLLTALMIYGRVGANNTAELGTMVVTEQIDALRVLAIDPIALPHRAALRRASSTTLFLDDDLRRRARALRRGVRGRGAARRRARASSTTASPSGLLGIGDVANGLVKSVVFGLVMALASCHFGLGVKGGAPGVGRAVNATVVASAAGHLRPRLPRLASRSDVRTARRRRPRRRERPRERAARRRARADGPRRRPRRARRSTSSAAGASSTPSSSARSTTASAAGARRAPSSSRCTRSATSRSSSSRS